MRAERVTLRGVLADPHVGPIIGIVFVLLTGLGLVFPTMPLFARSLGVGNDGAGLLISAFGLARLLGDLIGGSIVDRRGEQWTAVVGMAILAVCASATASAPNFPLAVVFWGLAGIGSAISFAALFSYILKAAPKDRVARTLSFFFGAFNIGVIVGGAIGGFVAEAFGLAAPLYGYSVVLLIGIALYVRFVPPLPSGVATETEEIAAPEAALTPSARPSSRVVRDLLKVRGFPAALFLNLAYLWVVGAVFATLLPLFAKDEIGMSTAAIGILYAIGVGAEFVVLFPAGTLSDERGRRAVMLPSLAALTVMIVVLGFATNAVMLTVGLALLSFASGFAAVPPAAILSDVVPAEHSGRGVGAFRFCGDLGIFAAPLVVGVVSQSLGFVWAFAITAVVPAVAFVVMLRSRETLVLANAMEGSSP